MAQVSANAITKKFGDVAAVDGISLTVRDGEFMVLLGPSGCGKTTFLRIIAGLEKPTAGDIVIGGEVVNDIPPRARGIAMVFQSYGLYPHFTIWDNIAFPLKTQRVPRPQIKAKVEWAALLLGIEHLLDRRPRQLSGGERQRVALARALVREPTAFPPGRAAVQSGCQAARLSSQRDQAVSATHRNDDDLCHSRPGRGDGDGRPHRRDRPRQNPPGGNADRNL